MYAARLNEANEIADLISGYNNSMLISAVQIDSMLDTVYPYNSNIVDKVNGILTVEEFSQMTEEYRKEKESLIKKISNIEEQCSNKKDMKKDELMKIVKSITDFKKIIHTYIWYMY